MSRFLRATDDGRLRHELDSTQRELDAARGEVERLRSALDSVHMGIVVTDDAGRPVLRNRAATLGGHADLLVNDAIDRLVSAARRGEPAQDRVNLFGPPMKVLLVRAVPLPEGGTLVTIEDLSERVRLDAVRTDFVSDRKSVV